MGEGTSFDEAAAIRARAALAGLAASSPDPEHRHDRIDELVVRHRPRAPRRQRLALAAVAAAFVLVLGTAWVTLREDSTPTDQLAGPSTASESRPGEVDIMWFHRFDDVASMATTSDSVVVVEVIGERFGSGSTEAELRFLQLRVREVLRGRDPGTFELHDGSLRVGGDLSVYRPFPVLEPGDLAVVFLGEGTEADDARWSAVGAEALLRLRSDGTLELGEVDQPSTLAAELEAMTLEELREVVSDVDDRITSGELVPSRTPAGIQDAVAMCRRQAFATGAVDLAAPTDEPDDALEAIEASVGEHLRDLQWIPFNESPNRHTWVGFGPHGEVRAVAEVDRADGGWLPGAVRDCTTVPDD